MNDCRVCEGTGYKIVDVCSCGCHAPIVDRESPCPSCHATDEISSAIKTLAKIVDTNQVTDEMRSTATFLIQAQSEKNRHQIIESIGEENRRLKALLFRRDEEWKARIERLREIIHTSSKWCQGDGGVNLIAKEHILAAFDEEIKKLL